MYRLFKGPFFPKPLEQFDSGFMWSLEEKEKDVLSCLESEFSQELTLFNLCQR